MLLMSSLLAGCGPTGPADAGRSPADATLTVAAYMEKGVPAPDRPWGAPDYAATWRALSTLPHEQLPSIRSDRSRTYVDRLAARENLEFLQNRTLPIKGRMGPSLELAQESNRVFKLYLAAVQDDGSRVADLFRLMSFSLRLTCVQCEMIEEFLPTLDKGDPTNKTRLEGLAQMKVGLAQTVQGALISLGDASLRTVDSRRDLAEAFAEMFPRIAPTLPPLTKDEFVATIRRLVESEPEGEVKATLGRAVAGD